MALQYAYPKAQNYKLHYVISLNDKSPEEVAGIRQALFRKGIDTQLPDMSACSLLSGFKSEHRDCPRSAGIAPSLIEIPSDVSLGQADLEYIAHSIIVCLG